MPVICTKCKTVEYPEGRQFPSEQSFRMHKLRVHNKVGSGYGDLAKGSKKAVKFFGKMAKAKRGKPPITEETRQKMAIAQKKRWSKGKKALAAFTEAVPTNGASPSLADAIAALEIRRDSLNETIDILKAMRPVSA